MAKRTQHERRDMLVKATIQVNKERVKKLVKFKYGSIENYLKKYGISRQWFELVLSKRHLSKDNKSLQDLSKNLEVSIDTILL